MARRLSKSKLLAFRQCPKRLWLEVHKPELRQDSRVAEDSQAVGNEVGAIARTLYDPEKTGALIDAQSEGFNAALDRSRQLLSSKAPIFEAGFATSDAIAFADILLPIEQDPQPSWRMVEVKSATGVKAYYLDDAAIQFNVARSAGVPLRSIAIAHIDNEWTYAGDQNYSGLLREVDVTAEAASRTDEVKEWIKSAYAVAAQDKEPTQSTGAHCSQPFECGFRDYCNGQQPQAVRPVGWLPRLQKKDTKAYIETKSIQDMSDVPDEYLNEIQKRVKAHTLSGTTYFDAAGAAKALAAFPLPALFLDFETVNLAIPIWKGTRPYQQIPFQFSLHHLTASGTLHHEEFLDLSGEDPSLPFAQSLLKCCEGPSPIFVYNRAFEAQRIKELAGRFAEQRADLLGLIDRLVDLHPVAAQYYYHPAQEGSWSIKKVLPTIAPDLDYAKLTGVQDGTMAMVAYREAIQPSTSQARKDEIRAQLSTYCRLDTYAMVRLWSFFAGRTDVSV